MPESNRDRSVERVLRHIVPEGASAPAGVCVDGEMLAAWVDGHLGAAQRSAVEGHLAECARCQAMMAALIRAQPNPPRAESLWLRSQVRWLVPLATAATVAGLWLALPGRMPVDEQPSSGADLAIDAPAPTGAPALPAAEAPTPVEPTARSSRQSANERREVTSDDAGGRAQSFDVRREKPLEDAAAAPPGALAEPREAAPAAVQRQAAASPVPPSQIEIAAADGGSRWRITNGQQVDWSSDGARWQPARVDRADALTGGSAPSSLVCWLVGRRGVVLRATDGRAFTRVPFPETADLVGVTASDDRTATVTAVDGRTWRTADGGMTWMIVERGL